MPEQHDQPPPVQPDQPPGKEGRAPVQQDKSLTVQPVPKPTCPPPSFLAWINHRLHWLGCLPSSPKFGDKTEFSALVSLFALAVVTTATFALTVNQVANSELLASVFYFIFVFVVIVLVALIVNGHDNGALKYNHATFLFGRWIGISTVTLALIFIFIAQMRWFPGQLPRRRDYIFMDVLCDKPLLGTQNYQASVTGVYRPAFMEERDGIDQFKDWFGGIANVDTSKAEERQLLIVEQSPGFDSDYNTFAAEIFLNPQVIFDGALVFIRRSSAGHVGSHNKYTLEQIRLPISNSTSRQYPVVEITNPNVNDSLLIFLRVSAEKGGKLDTHDPNWFQFKLRRVPR
jgi:hypothetical protein